MGSWQLERRQRPPPQTEGQAARVNKCYSRDAPLAEALRVTMVMMAHLFMEAVIGIRTVVVVDAPSVVVLEVPSVNW